MTCGNGAHCTNPPAPGRKTCERHLQLARDRWKRQKAECADHGPDTTCAHCRREAARKARSHAATDRIEHGKRCRRHGITPERYLELLAAQGGGCAICGCLPENNERNRRLHIDHDHDCCPGPYGCAECVRGLLCYRCNVGLGAFDDDAARLSRAATYLERKA